MVVVKKKQKIIRADKRQWKQQLFYEDGSTEEGLPFFAFRTHKRVHPPPSASSSSARHHAHLHFGDCIASLIHCAKFKSLSEGKSVHACIVDHCLDRNSRLRNLLVQMYARCDAMDDALSVFSNMCQKNLFTWNALISACACHGHREEALKMFHRMRRDGFTPNKFIFASIITACSNCDALHEGEDIHVLIRKCGLECDIYVGTALVNMYGKCGRLDDAKELFLMLPERDLVTWNAMIAACAQHNRQWDALRLYHQMLQEGSIPDEYSLASVLDVCVSLTALLPGKYIHASMVARGYDSDIVLGTALIDLYGQCGSLEGALATFDFMPEHNRITFINILSVCATYVAVDEGRRMHTIVEFYGLMLDVNLGNAFVNMYGKCSSLVDAYKMFCGMPERDIISWNAVIAAYAQHGEVKNALSLFAQMCRGGVLPDSITFINVLSACSHAGLVHQGFNCFVLMEQDHGVAPTVDHYNCVIDLLVRAGQLHEAEQLLKCMRVEPTSISWTTLLGACRTDGDMQRGGQIAKHVLKLDPSNPAHYVTLSNIYSAAGNVDDATKIMNMLRDMDLDCGQFAAQQVEM